MTAHTAPAPLFYSVTEAAQVLGLSPANVRDRCNRGELGAIRYGKLWKLPRNVIDGMAGGADHGHEAVSSERDEKVRELRRMHAEMGRLLAELEG
jgi:excisionase family DNA binding protein